MNSPIALRHLAGALILGVALAAPLAQAENPPATQRSEIDPRAPGEPAAISPRGDYPPAQQHRGVAERSIEAVEDEALTADKPADAGVDELSKQQEREQQQSAAIGTGEAPTVYDERTPAGRAPGS